MSVLKKRRKDLGLTLFALSLQAGIRESVISAVEGRKQVAHPKTRKIFSKFYGVDESELFDAVGFARESGDE